MCCCKVDFSGRMFIVIWPLELNKIGKKVFINSKNLDFSGRIFTVIWPLELNKMGAKSLYQLQKPIRKFAGPGHFHPSTPDLTRLFWIQLKNDQVSSPMITMYDHFEPQGPNNLSNSFAYRSFCFSWSSVCRSGSHPANIFRMWRSSCNKVSTVLLDRLDFEHISDTEMYEFFSVTLFVPSSRAHAHTLCHFLTSKSLDPCATNAV